MFGKYFHYINLLADFWTVNVIRMSVDAAGFRTARRPRHSHMTLYRKRASTSHVLAASSCSSEPKTARLPKKHRRTTTGVKS